MLVFAPLDYSNGTKLRTGAYLYLQSENFSALARLKRVRGVVGLVTHGDSNNPRQAIQIDPKSVDVMIEARRSSTIKNVSDRSLPADPSASSMAY